MTLPDPQITPLFATSLVVDEIADAAAIDAQLESVITDRCGREAKRPGVAWRGGKDLLSWGGEAAQHLSRQAIALADRLTVDVRNPAGSRYRWRPAATACLARTSEVVLPARPPLTFWAGVYIVKDGYLGAADPALEGELVLEDPRFPATLIEAPNVRLRTQPTAGAPLYSEEVVLRPAQGRLLLYPGWLRISHRAHHAAGARIWIDLALDAIPSPARRDQ